MTGSGTDMQLARSPLATSGLSAVLAVVMSIGLTTAPAQADTTTATAWVDEGAVRVRLIDAGPAGQGKHRLGFEIDLDAGWKTYWRHPGETGVAPQFSWDRSFNVAEVTPRFPAPTRFIDSNMVSFGYETDVVLPLEVTLAKPGPALVSLDVTYAVCADICLPLRASFEIALDPKPDMRGTFLVERALRRVPSDTPPAAIADGLTVAAAEGAAALDVTVPIAGADGTLVDLFAEGPEGWHLPPATPVATGEAVKIFRIDLGGMPDDRRKADAALRLTVVHPAGAFEQTVPLPEQVLAGN